MMGLIGKDFVGPKREKRGGRLLALGQRCSWVTTCKLTGMANSYSMSKATKTFLRNQLTGQLITMTEAAGEEESSKQLNGHSVTSIVSMPHTAGKIRLRQLPSGEQRLYTELAERQRREDLLRCFGLIRNNGSNNDEDYNAEVTAKWNSGNDDRDRDRSRGYEEEDYEHDFDNDNDVAKKGDKAPDGAGEVNANNASQSNKEKEKETEAASVAEKDKSKDLSGESNACEYSSWTTDKRKLGLRYLMDVSKDFRHEEILKTLLVNGSVPEAPRIWSNSVLDEDDEGDEGVALERLSTELKICWVRSFE